MNHCSDEIQKPVVHVSILIPCYNARRWIAQAIESALAQTWPSKEVIVIDDGSTDGSLEVIKDFSGRISWESGFNQGGNVARNRLMELARGQWLQYLDADDYLLPDKIAAQMEFAVRSPEPDVVFSPTTWEYWSENQTYREVVSIPVPHDEWVLLARWYLPQTGGSLWRKDALIEVGGWNPNQPCCQEHELYLRLMMAKKRFVYCGHSGAVYRQWSEQTVCKRDKPETHRRRLEIEQRIENVLCERNQLTLDRRRAINQTRFEIARSVWQYDPAHASEIIASVRHSEPGFIPGGDAAPMHYRLAFQALSFAAAERLAKWKRQLLNPRATTT